MHGKVELVAVTFPDSISLPRAGEILTVFLGRQPTEQDSLHITWTDGRDQVRLVKGRNRPATAVVSPVPKRSTGPGCPAK